VDGVVKGMIDKEMVKEITGHSRNRIYSLHKYLEIFAHEKENEENLF